MTGFSAYLQDVSPYDQYFEAFGCRRRCITPPSGSFLTFEDGLDCLSEVLWHRHLDVFGLSMAVPGVRLTLWLAGLIILASGVLAVVSLRAGPLIETDSEEGL